MSDGMLASAPVGMSPSKRSGGKARSRAFAARKPCSALSTFRGKSKGPVRAAATQRPSGEATAKSTGRSKTPVRHKVSD